jgi:hypothetical protein
MKRSIVTAFFICATMTVAQAQNEVQGNWEGPFQTLDGANAGTLTAQVIADSNQTYSAVVSIALNGQPGPHVTLAGKTEGANTVFASAVDVGYDLGGKYNVTGAIAGDTFTGKFTGYEAEGTFTLKKKYVKSPTLGAPAPGGAIVLYDGKNTAAWQYGDGKPITWTIMPDGALEVSKGSILTKQLFGNHKLHIEFRTPLMPAAKGQARGNSGVYVLGRYEVQVLDSFGLEGKDNECGGIYKIAAPRVNACLPPTEWQTYDIIFQTAQLDGKGKKIKNAVITIQHNGITIHDHLELTGVTGGALKSDEPNRGPLMLQDHHNPVQYRNIWVQPM